MALPRILQVLIDHRGTVVCHEFTRTGRRAVLASGGGLTSRKPRKKQRKATLSLPPIHPLLTNALERLEQKALHKYMQYAEEAAEAEHAVEEEEPIVGEEAAGLEGLQEVHCAGVWTGTLEEGEG